MQRGNHSINTLTIREFVAIHMMAIVSKDVPQKSRSASPNASEQARRSMELTDALLAELSKDV